MSDTIIASIITGGISLIVGFISGYGVCIKMHKKINMKQNAKNNSNQIQIGEINGEK